MKHPYASVCLAVCASLSIATTVASAYFPSQFLSVDTQTVSGSTSSSSMSSSILSSRASQSSTSAQAQMQSGALQLKPNLSAQTLCMEKAAAARETLIEQALNAYYQDMSGALAKRKGMVLQAWNNTDSAQQRLALQSVWRSFGMYWKVSDDMLHQIIRNAWKHYQSDRANCGLKGYDPELGGLGDDAQF